MSNINDSYQRDLEEWAKKPHTVDMFYLRYSSSPHSAAQHAADVLADAIRSALHQPRN